MALLINDDCTACDACKPVCPNEAISVGDPIYVIDPLRCTECVGAEDEPQCKLVCGPGLCPLRRGAMPAGPAARPAHPGHPDETLRQAAARVSLSR